jgi:outer membrane biosynthesis protein TonB
MGEITQKTYTKARIVGYTGSIGTGIILFLILFFTYIYTPIPPYPEGGGGGGMGLEVNLGYAETGLGDLQQSQVSIPDFTQETSPAPKAEAKPQEVLSQDLEETASINDAPKTKTKTEPKVVSAVQTKKPKTVTVTEKPKVVNKTALYKPGTTTATNGEGVTQGPTDQGVAGGKQGSALYGQGGSGGTGPGSGGGSGGGTGGGIGSGVGDGVGPGISFNLDGRSMILIREPVFDIQREGIVVVEITVDQNGKVIAATPGVKGSTIADNTLWAAARRAALESKFNIKSDAPERQVGRITYHFKLK